jgi:hypothetical protein
VTSTGFNLLDGGGNATVAFNGTQKQRSSATPAASATSPTQIATTQTLPSSSVNPSVAGQTVTFTATVSPASPVAGTLAGTVQFSIDGASTGAPEPLNASGQATYSTGALPDGQSTIIAAYSGGSGFTGSIAAPLTQSVLDFVLVGGPTKAATVFPGQSAEFEFAIAPQGAFSSPVTFSASGLPPGATASFDPQSVTPSAAPTTVVLTIQTAKLIAAVRPALPISATPALLLALMPSFPAAAIPPPRPTPLPWPPGVA